MNRFCKSSEPSVSFSLLIRTWRQAGDISAMCLFYRPASSTANASSGRGLKDDGDIDERAGTLILTQIIGGDRAPAGYLWQVDSSSGDFAWTAGSLMRWGLTRRSDLEGFLGQCFEIATRDPDKAFRAVFV